MRADDSVGEAILSGVNAIERSQADSTNEMLESLVRQHSRLVYRIAYSVLRSHHDAEDSTQETFMRVLRYSAKLANVDDPKTWLARIAWHVALDRSKHRGRAREITMDDPENPVPEPPSPLSSADQTIQESQRDRAAKAHCSIAGEIAGSATTVSHRRGVPEGSSCNAWNQ